MKRRRRTEAGFTIVELLLVIVLIIILYRLFMPRYTHLAILKHEVYATARALEADLIYTQQLAAAGGLSGNSGEEYWLKFKTVGSATDTWYIYKDGDEANPVKETTVLSGIEIFSTGTPYLYYTATGTTSLPNGGSIDVFDSKNYYRWRVSVVRGTGSVELTGM